MSYRPAPAHSFFLSVAAVDSRLPCQIAYCVGQRAQIAPTPPNTPNTRPSHLLQSPKLAHTHNSDTATRHALVLFRACSCLQPATRQQIKEHKHNHWRPQLLSRLCCSYRKLFNFLFVFRSESLTTDSPTANIDFM